LRLTATPQKIGAADLAPLRAVGLSDTDIHDLVQVVAYFNYITRIADGLGTEPEPEMPKDLPKWAKEMRGDPGASGSE
jgi:uncharacterized protein YciW